MPSDHLTLGFDTSAAHCAAALLSGSEVIAARAEAMGRGQAERLFPLIEELLTESGIRWRDLSRIGVGTGPGNFTGIRIAVAAARGLALSLDVPVIGISSFAATRLTRPGAAVAVSAPRGQVYLERPGDPPVLVDAAEAQGAAMPPAAVDLAIAIARAANAVAYQASDPLPPPAPLYLRAADAAPPRDAPPEIVDDA
ncbi:tRNA (adenosine(37)-N6)-threonylcarbamoyltransferase complex dimerization subunit type 1 TsaB [Pseudooceanicola sp.]|uniref:tRNA (adenosine(37)-N6)-threonylcarbamoyltransferase complex dimerization subunit type 1 TsaB n=1 Tax=Pseudooceanicola sp. TaxID=1914328 RepID=UPI00261B7E9F|nr:tRNA (adenosine(37)-N6)-threonylcarbamoyltransferase complex dimerization subunit type 1 TsaB [Pseudooceanicola sp.]MDF1854666.1 tRNA (adenosine(37)-N6)-threonylcarbamoyltransferase complex dimerization subunit type 1 TsaB [Pseudooceanicola sp.]